MYEKYTFIVVISKKTTLKFKVVFKKTYNFLYVSQLKY